MNEPFRHTKIVATIGPSCSDAETLLELMRAGADVFRLNFSHGDAAEKALIIERIRELSRRRQRAVAILGDLQGPKIRVGQIEGEGMQLFRDERVWLTTEDVVGRDNLIPTGYAGLLDDVQVGDRLLLDDGLLELVVETVEPPRVGCRVLIGGLLKSRKGINLPGVAVSVPALTEKDRQDLDFCLEHGVDYVALSFVRRAEEVLELKGLVGSDGPGIIAKIEKPEAVDHFDAILEAADGIMVARGDLGVELDPEKVPLIQKRIVRQCNRAGKPVITATQMLESMVGSPRPTRAETSDVANAILDGTDAVMLSAETASGRYPVEAVAMMARIALDVESDPHLSRKVFEPLPEVSGWRSLPEAIAQAACRVAESLEAKAVLAFTQTGKTAALVSKYRPRVPVYAVTPSQRARRRLALFHGVRSLRVDIEGNTEAQIDAVEQAVLDAGLMERGDVVVITMGSPVSAPGTTNLMKVHRLATGSFYEVH
ncbi:MAG: pyruvate kinase [Deltaproteobacteria bacterium]|nr:MAG: pyruvate kinase [Deltaproteobacteria bacterium]